tara:strand:- start:66107 stop:67297 length:1191 start_codon:yes stop_codon:yes gene_type:complete
MRSIKGLDFTGKRALVRVDFNVPINEEGKITDDTRIRAALPTINTILENNGSVVLMSHLGRPKNGPEDKFSLNQLVDHLSSLINKDVKFANDCIGDEAVKLTSSLQKGEVVLLENLRFHNEEKAGDRTFAEQLSKHGDIYINDAFGTAHRAHASTAIIADFFPNDKYFGILLENEILNIDKVLKSPQSPTLAVVGGAKVSSKITIIENLLETVDDLIIGGGMAYTFIKAQGGKIGASLVEDDYLETAKGIMNKATEKGVNIHLPSDTIVADKFDAAANTQEQKIDQIEDGWMGLDIGKESIDAFRSVILNSKTILWNGPMGVFEMEKFQKGTVLVAEAIAESTQNGAFSLVGGGDSVAAVNQFNLSDQVSYVSTGGGAMLEYLEGKVLPGIQAIRS